MEKPVVATVDIRLVKKLLKDAPKEVQEYVRALEREGEELEELNRELEELERLALKDEDDELDLAYASVKVPRAITENTVAIINFFIKWLLRSVLRTV